MRSSPRFPRLLSRRARRPDSGFTLMEALIAVALLAALGVGALSLAFSGTAVAGDVVDQQADAASAQLASVVFARDVQAAASVGSTHCGDSGDGDPLVTLVDSSVGGSVTYRDLATTDGHRITRAECDAGGAVISSRTVLDGLESAPRVSCEPDDCAVDDSPPRVITLEVTRSESFSFALDGSRRTVESDGSAATLPVDLFLFGGSTPLSVKGNGSLTVNGNAFVNSGEPDAISVSGGNARLSATGDIGYLQGGGCQGCTPTNVTPFPPVTLPTALPDPLAYLPEPDEAGMAVGTCSGSVCTPGVYDDVLSIKDTTTLLPGTYVLHQGFSAGGKGRLEGTDVLLFNGCGRNAPAGCESGEGTFKISGRATVNLTPSTSGPYADMLVFQSRTNTQTASVSGGGQLMLFSGIMYAPAAERVVLGAGGGGLRLGAVIASGLEVSGNGTVQVDGV